MLYNVKYVKRGYYMEKKPFVADTYFLRRLLLSDLLDIKKLYDKLGADSIWTENDALIKIFAHGEIWGCIHNKNIVAVCGFCTSKANLHYVNLLIKHNIMQKNDIIIIPPCGHFTFFKNMLTFIQNIISTQYVNNRYAFCIPAKTGANYAKISFNCNMTLYAMRPLEHLRVNYVFFSKAHIKTDITNSTTLNFTSSFELSKNLEHGYCGVDISGNNVLLEKML